MQEEKVEEAVVELSSFSGSAISAHSVLDYLLLLLMKGQEPLVSKVGGAGGWGTIDGGTVTLQADSSPGNFFLLVHPSHMAIRPSLIAAPPSDAYTPPQSSDACPRGHVRDRVFDGP